MEAGFELVDPPELVRFGQKWFRFISYLWKVRFLRARWYSDSVILKRIKGIEREVKRSLEGAGAGSVQAEVPTVTKTKSEDSKDSNGSI